MAKDRVQIKVDSKGIQEIVKELIKLGDPKWVMGRYKAASKKSLQPALKRVISTAPKSSKSSGALKGSFIINAKNSKKKKGRTDARVGVGKRKFFLVDGKLVQRIHLINAIEFSKKGHPGKGFIRKAMNATAKPNQITSSVEDFMAKAVKKRARYNTRPRKKKK
jgi:hypothetical protein